MRVLGTLSGEGSPVVVRLFEDGLVEFTADCSIDADGANGQNGKIAAYMVGNKGSEHLANGGMTERNGRVVGNSTWFKDIVITGPDGQPRVFPGGIIASKTAYRYPGFNVSDPVAYVDSETIPYVVVPPLIINGVGPVVLGCRAVAANIKTGVKVEGVVADVGPRTKAGEVSIEMARRLGINPSPRIGGTSDRIIRYQIHPGTPAVINGRPFVLQTSKGTHINPCA